jgi:hypothetical protein
MQKRFVFGILCWATLFPTAANSQAHITYPTSATQIVISSKPDNPTFELKIDAGGLNDQEIAALGLRYTAQIAYDRSSCVHDQFRQFNTGSGSKPVSSAKIQITMPEIVAGQLSVKLTNSSGNVIDQVNGVTVVATNPTRAQAKAAFPNLISAKISSHESGMRQFLADPGDKSRCPLWSQDNRGGAGIAQLTLPVPSAMQVWNWRENINGEWKSFQDKLRVAGLYAGRVQHASKFMDLVRNFNAKRAANGLGAVTVLVPAFESGDLDNNPLQLQLDGLRGYNGFAGKDWFRMSLHEFRVKLDATSGDLVVRVDEATNSGTIVWERVPASDRPSRGSGDPNYVNNVLRQTP